MSMTNPDLEVIEISNIRAAMRAKNKGGFMQKLARDLEEQGVATPLSSLESFAYDRDNVLLPMPALCAIVKAIWGWNTTIENNTLFRVKKPSIPAGSGWPIPSKVRSRRRPRGNG